jgi:hypothetical protein
MRNYQTLTVIGGIITILIVLAVAFLFSVGNVVHRSFGNYTTQYGTQSDINKYNKDRQMFSGGVNYLSAAIPIGVFGSVAAMVLVFVIKDRFKPLGIILIVLGVIVVIATGGFGIVGFAMFVVAGIVVLRYKPKPSMELTK